MDLGQYMVPAGNHLAVYPPDGHKKGQQADDRDNDDQIPCTRRRAHENQRNEQHPDCEQALDQAEANTERFKVLDLSTSIE